MWNPYGIGQEFPPLKLPGTGGGGGKGSFRSAASLAAARMYARTQHPRIAYSEGKHGVEVAVFSSTGALERWIGLKRNDPDVWYAVTFSNFDTSSFPSYEFERPGARWRVAGDVPAIGNARGHYG